MCHLYERFLGTVANNFTQLIPLALYCEIETRKVLLYQYVAALALISLVFLLRFGRGYGDLLFGPKCCEGFRVPYELRLIFGLLVSPGIVYSGL